MTAHSPIPFPANGQRKLTARENYERIRAQRCLTVSGRRLFALATTVFLIACQPSEENVAVPYGAVNHTDIGVAAIAINGHGGAENIGAHEAGNAGMCCVVVPKVWRPGLTVTIQWRENGRFLHDANGKEVLDDGVPVLIEAPWKSRTVTIPRYDGSGRLFIFFFPGDDVRAALTSSPEWEAWGKPTPADLAYDATH